MNFIKYLVFATYGLLFCLQSSHASEGNTHDLAIPVDDQELSIVQYPAKGEHLVIWVAPGYGSHERAHAISRKLAKYGVEVWHVDLADSLFLTKNTTTMRGLDGRYVAGLIETAHIKTGKQITLLTRSYGSLPVLRGARLWQLKHETDNANYLSGAILFSPELYKTVPELGLDPVYSPIASATNIPIMLYQAGKRGNRWQLEGLLDLLRQGGAEVYVKIKAGLIGMFYQADKSKAALDNLQTLPKELLSDLKFLKNLTTPKIAKKLSTSQINSSHGLNSSLKKFQGNVSPPALRLLSSNKVKFNQSNFTGKVTVVNFWASWCPPCVEEIPSLNSLKKAMHGKPFELISVNYAEDKNVVLDFMKQVDVDFPVLLDEDGRTSAKWKVLVFPSTFIIGVDGKIKYGVNGAIQWDSPEIIETMNALLSH